MSSSGSQENLEIAHPVVVAALFPECALAGDQISLTKRFCRKDRFSVPVDVKTCNACQLRLNPPQCLPSVPPIGKPGSVLTRIIFDIGGMYKSGCNCQDVANMMDAIGCDGCEKIFEHLVDMLNANFAKLTTWEASVIVAKSVAKGYALTARSTAGFLRLAIDTARKEAEPVTTTPAQVEPARRIHPQDYPRWSYGITTTPHRIDTFLPQTIRSLAAAGFDEPLLGVDNCKDCKAFERFGLPFTARSSHNHNHANWFLTAQELFYRNPFAEFYAIFEDDLIISRGAREYLEKTMVEPKGYYSLWTNPDNERRPHQPNSWFMSNQRGEGAVGLVFSKDAFLNLLGNVGTLLHARQIVNPRDGTIHKNLRGEPTPHGKEYVDGLILSAMHQRGYIEWCHSPSIVQHVGHDSSAAHVRFPDAPNFRGEEFDLRSLLK